MSEDGESGDGINQGFAKAGGEALNLDDNDRFNDSEDVDDIEDENDNDSGDGIA